MTWGIAAAGVIIGLAAGYSLFSAPRTEPEPMTGRGQDAGTAPMAHAGIEVDASRPAPTVAIQAVKDTKDGYNLRIVTDGYVWTPQDAGGEPTQGEGHAHLYVNGVKVARLYGEWFHLPGDKLADGENVIEVTLNADDHSEWLRGGEHVAASVTVVK